MTYRTLSFFLLSARQKKEAKKNAPRAKAPPSGPVPPRRLLQGFGADSSANRCARERSDRAFPATPRGARFPSIRSLWQSFWFANVPPHALALLRIAFGVFLIIEWLAYLPRVVSLFSSQGFVIPMFESASVPMLQYFLEPLSPTLSYIVYAGLLLSLVLFTLGWDMRTQGFAIAAYMLYYYQLSFHLFPSSYHRIFFFLVVVLSLSGADRTFSLRMKVQEGSALAWEPIAIWPQRIIAIQLCVTYLGVGLQKLILPAWQGGEILSYSFLGRWATPLAFSFVRLGLPMWFYDTAVFLVKLLHITFPIGIWFRSSRLWYMGAGALFHILVALMMGMWWFLALIPAYVVFFDPSGVQRWLEHRFPVRWQHRTGESPI